MHGAKITQGNVNPSAILDPRYVNVSGDTMTGVLLFENNITVKWKDTVGSEIGIFYLGSDNVARIGVLNAPATNGHLLLYTNGTEKARISPAGVFNIGGTTFTKATLGAGDLTLDNGTTDVSGIHFYHGNNVNLGLDTNAYNSGLVTVQSFRFVKNLGETGGLVLMTLGIDGNIVINDSGASTADVRMEGDTDANLFFLDASADFIGIGTISPSVKLDLVGDFKTTSASNSPWQLIKTGSTGISFSSYYPTVAFNMYHNGTQWVAQGTGFTGLVQQAPTTGLTVIGISAASRTVGDLLGSAPTVNVLSLAYDGKMTLGGTYAYIQTVSNTNLILLPNGTGYTIIGDGATTSHSFNTNDDLFVSGRLEVDGSTYFDSTVYSGSHVVVASGQWLMFNTFDVTGIIWSVSQATNTMLWGLHTTPKSLIITDYANRNKDHDHAVQTNPTLFIHSATDPDTANTQWISFTHNQTNGVINTGLGNLTFGQTLTSDTDSTDDLGTSSIYWANGYIDKIYLNATATLDGAGAGIVALTGRLNVSGITQFQNANATIEYTTDHMSINKGADAGVYLFEGAVTPERPDLRIYGYSTSITALHYGRLGVGTWGSFQIESSNNEIEFLSVITTRTTVQLWNDNVNLIFGGGLDASIYYDGTNLVVNPKLVGTGMMNVLGNIAVSGNQVVGARVVDARCDDAINSGDATTDGVIDALRDAMITHGLIAAA